MRESMDSIFSFGFGWRHPTIDRPSEGTVKFGRGALYFFAVAYCAGQGTFRKAFTSPIMRSWLGSSSGEWRGLFSTLADKGKILPLVQFIGQAVERSLDIYLKTLTPIGKQKESYLPLSKISKQILYSGKYLNLLVRQGKLEAYKQGRDWLTSIEAVKRYQDNRKRKR